MTNVGYLQKKGDANTRIDFSAILKWAPSRAPSKAFEQGDLDGNGVAETSGASLLKMKLTIEIESTDTKTALELWNDLDNFIAQYNDEQQTLVIIFDYDTSQQIEFTGKALKGATADFIAGDINSFVFSLGFTVELKEGIT